MPSQLREFAVVLPNGVRHFARSLMNYEYAVVVEDNGQWVLRAFVISLRDAEIQQANALAEYARMSVPRTVKIHILPTQALTLDAAAERRYNLEAQERQEMRKEKKNG